MAKIRVNIVKEQDIKIELHRRGVAGSNGTSGIGTDGTSGSNGTSGTSGTSVYLCWGTAGTISTSGLKLGSIYMQLKET